MDEHGSPGALFLRSASEGNTGSLRELLGAGVAIDGRGPHGETALIAAAQADQVETVRWLAGRGASIDARDGGGSTALMHAAARGNDQTVKTLLQLGADPAVQNRRGQDSLVMATIGGEASIADLLRDRILDRRDQVAREQAERVGAEFSDPPRDKTGVFMSGLRRDDDVPIDPGRDAWASDGRIGEEMARTIPLTTFDGWLKQIDATELNPMGRLALDRGFPMFLSFVDFSEDVAHNLLTRRGGGVQKFHRPHRTRRYAGGDSLPRGRYFSLCRDEDGDDGGTLKGELWAYYRAHDAGLIDILDYSLPGAARGYAEGYGISFPDPGRPALALLFLPGQQAPSPFTSLIGADESSLLAVVIPARTSHSRIEATLDLREPEAAQWFTHYFSRLTMKMSDEKWVRCWPFRPGLDSFQQILPTLLTQERGGGRFGLAVGSWLRQHGVDALIFPSARSDCGVEVTNGKVVSSTGWNLVDYRNADPPYFKNFLDIGDYWEEAIRTGIGLGVGRLPETDPYQQVRIEYTADGDRRGSWSVIGVVAVRTALLAAEIEQYVGQVSDGVVRPGLSWVSQLPIARDVQKWVAAFVCGEYPTCVEWGMSLLPRIESYEMLQMFLISLHRQGSQPAGGGWKADEVLQQLTPQLMDHHRHDQVLQSLLGITLGLVTPAQVIQQALDPTHRARAQYYGAARLISEGQRSQAYPYLDACVRSGANALETHLALAELDY